MASTNAISRKKDGPQNVCSGSGMLKLDHKLLKVHSDSPNELTTSGARNLIDINKHTILSNLALSLSYTYTAFLHNIFGTHSRAFQEKKKSS